VNAYWEPDFPDCKLLMAIAQAPFENAGNRFATLAPLVWVNGSPAAPRDFPNTGLIWWKIPDGYQRADPGRILSGRLEDAPRWDDDPDKSRYQVRYEITDVPLFQEAIEIVAARDPNLLEPKDLLAGGTVLEMDHPPTPICLVRFSSHLYGPMRATAVRDPQSDRVWRVTFTVQAADKTVLQIPDSELLKLKDGYCDLRSAISLTSIQPSKSSYTIDCGYEILLGSGWNDILSRHFPRMVLESDLEIVNRLAKTFLTNKQRQTLMGLLRDLDTSLPDPGALPAGAKSVLQMLRNRLNAQNELDRVVAEALLDSGVLDARLAQGIEERAQSYIAQNTTKLGAEIELNIATRQDELTRLKREQEDLQGQLESQRLAAKRGIEDDWNSHRNRCQAEEARIDEARRDLTRLQDEVTGRLEGVLKRFAEGRDQLINEFLALSPLLNAGRESGFSQGQRDGKIGVEPAGLPELVFPAFVIEGGKRGETTIREIEFFERFLNHVKNCGFSYRRSDLISFHISVKTCGLTVLGGPSGTGKSSLPRLYADALAGAEEAERYLQVGVSPSWLDMRDLLGHVNALERTFEPSESGLYLRLIHAQKEFENWAQSSGIYLFCLDEMNLAHVEHYFSGFLQALDGPERKVRCFDPASTKVNSRFAGWGTLHLPPSIRFVGTVNFDETTKQISLRVKDRANLLRLRTQDNISTSGSQPEPRTKVPGIPVTLRDLRSWDASRKLEVELASLVDSLDPFLRKLGCPPSPRRKEAMRRFISAAPPELCNTAEALDYQIAQRLLPQARGLYRNEAREALDGLEQLLKNQRHHFAEALLMIQDLREEEQAAGLFADIEAAG
jgi:hypothetical protein